MPIVLQPIDQNAKMELAQQLACWAKMATGMTDPAVQYGTCCVSPTGQTLGRWTIPDDLCTLYGPLPFTGNDGQAIVCPPVGADYMPYYIYDSDVVPIDPNTCVAPTEQLDVPTGLAAGEITATTIALSWDAVVNATSYRVQFSVDGGTTWDSVITTDLATVLVGLAAETEYTIRIAALDDTGTYLASDFSATITATTLAALVPLDAPLNLASGTIAELSIGLTWDAVTGADGYVVAYSDDGGTTWVEVTVALTATDLLGLIALTEYTIRVKATDSTGTFGDSAWSATITATTLAP